MKKITLILFFIISHFAFSQTNGITYQAVLYNSKGESLPGINTNSLPMANKKVCLQFTFINSNSQVEYQERVQTTTDAFGMVNLVIGTGNQIGGFANSFNEIIWNNSQKKLKTELDSNGNCTSFEEISNQPLNYVPFALAANTANSVAGIVDISNGGTAATTVQGAKSNLQLENVDNTSDLSKPISTATQLALNNKIDQVTGKSLVSDQEIVRLSTLTNSDTNKAYVDAQMANKVDKVTGKNLSTEDYSTAEKTKLAALTGTNTGDQDLSSYATLTGLGLKVDKIAGKDLSTEDYSTIEKTKLAAITGTNTGDQDISGIEINSSKIGNLSSLTTTAQSTLVNAVNEIQDFKAPLASPSFTGIPLTPTAIAGTNTTQIATTEFVSSAIIGKFVDVTTNQIIAGEKTFSSNILADGIKISEGGGKTGIGTLNPNQESSLEIATALPVILPLMSQNQIDAMASPTAGMVQYNKTENKLQVYSTNGSSSLSTVFGNSSTSNGATCLAGSGELWFRPTVSGMITQVELSAFGSGETASLVLKSDFSCGSAAVLGTSNSITCVDGWNTWTFATPVSVIAGTTYYITSNDATNCLGVRWANGDDLTTGNVGENIFGPGGGCVLNNSDPASRITVVSTSATNQWVNLLDGADTTLQTNIDTIQSDVDANETTVNTALALKAPLASPILTGIPIAPTPAVGISTDQIATTAFVTDAVNTATTGKFVDLSTSQTIAGDKTFSGKITGVNSNLSGTLGVGTTTIDPSAQLEINSTNKGLLLPRLTTSQINEIANPTPGLLVFNTTLNAFQGFIGANPNQPNLFDWYTIQNYGYSRILQDYMINQTFTSQGQSVTSMDLATVNIGGVNSGVFNLKIYDWNNYSNPLLYNAGFTVSSAGKITIDFGSSITLPKGECTIVISCISGAADFGIGGGSQGSLYNSYWESLGGTGAGYTNPSDRPLAATLYTNGSMSIAKGSWHSF
jgi:hypothetical protein